MKKNFLTRIKSLALLSMIGVVGAAFTACTEDIDQSNRYTFVGKTITDYIEEDPDNFGFSKFSYLLDKAHIGKSSSSSILKTLSTYGAYTCFAPTDEAIDIYLQEQYEIWHNSLDSAEIEDTGIYSPYLEDLSDSMATVIAKNHIIEAAFFTTDIKSDGAFPKNNINNRFTTVSFENDEQGNVVILINNSAQIIKADYEAENGIVHVVDHVVAPSNKLLCDHFAQYEEFSIHSDAITITGLDEVLRIYELDPNYDPYMTSPIKMSTSAMGAKAPYPETYVQKYTLLAVTNTTYAKYGITDFASLVAYAERWYGEEAKGDYKNPENALYKLISYHIIDRQLLYNGTAPGGFVMDGLSDTHDGYKASENIPNTFDRYDYFETLHPYSIIKATRPSINSPRKDDLILNYSQEEGTVVKNSEMKEHINVRVLPISEATELAGLEKFDDNTLNGSIHVIDRLLIYNEDEMKGNVLNERMRWDSSSLFPELTNNGVRWHERKDGWKEIYIPDGYCKRLKVNNESTLPFYLPPHPNQLNGWANYQGDEILVDGQYDFQYRIPHVPEGTYEIRFGFGFSSARGICQFYLDNKITGIPVDMFYYDNKRTMIAEDMATIIDGAFAGDQDAIDEYDKILRNRGWMKGPASVFSNGSDSKSMRESKVAYRRIVTQAHLTKGDHWLRFKDVTVGGGNLRQFSQDYLEIVPKSVITDPARPEDKN